jgi:integrase
MHLPMASLEHIYSNPIRPEIQNGKLEWVTSRVIRPIERLPLIFWGDGNQWGEVNLWALEKARVKDVKLKTINTLMEHLHKYANWLEEQKIDWRHFPTSKAERVLVRFRGFLIGLRDSGDLSPSTASARMSAVIQFYRYANAHNFICHGSKMWEEKAVAISYFDPAGFKRTIQRITADISIPNRARQGFRLEDGLLPITSDHQSQLLKFTKENASDELHLMLLIGFYTGARLCTITSLRKRSLEQAFLDPQNKGFWLVPIGPGTGISTKFDVSGELMVHESLMMSLRAYATSSQHIERAIKAAPENKSFLFLTRHRNPYTTNAVGREMVNLRRKGVVAGLKFLTKFKFHQTRSTYGTWLMSLLLSSENISLKAAIEFVKRAMHHKHESTTFRYITFIEHTKVKIKMANEFTNAFFGLANTLSEKKEV